MDLNRGALGFPGAQRMVLARLQGPGMHSGQYVCEFMFPFWICCFSQHFATFNQQTEEISGVLPLEISVFGCAKNSTFQRTLNQVHTSFPREMAHFSAERARNLPFECYFSTIGQKTHDKNVY